MKYKVGQKVTLCGTVDDLSIDGITGTIISTDGVLYDYLIKFNHPIRGEMNWWVYEKNILTIGYNQREELKRILGGVEKRDT